MSIAKANTHCTNLYTLVDFAVFGADKEVKSLGLVQRSWDYEGHDVVDFNYSVLSRFDINFQVLTSAK